MYTFVKTDLDDKFVAYFKNYDFPTPILIQYNFIQKIIIL